LKTKKNNFAQSNIVRLKDDRWLMNQKLAGRCVSQSLVECGNLIKEKTPNLSLMDLENIVLQRMKIFNCIPTFLGYKGFPNASCISVNNQLVHGIPSDYILKDGDIVKVDLGATFEGSIADAARTWIYGTPKSPEHVRMLKTCYEALNAGIKAVGIGKQIGVVGNAIWQFTKNSGFGLVTNYGGHWIEYHPHPHAWPFVSNKAQPNEGIRIQHGSTFAIEPMLVIGDPATKVLPDGWTVITNGYNCHFEDTIYLTNNEIHIITETPYEKY
jgi:methionyl aminopeptidase